MECPVIDNKRTLIVCLFTVTGHRNIRYFVDLALIPVVLVSLLLFLSSVWSWPPNTWNLRELTIGAFILTGCIGLAKEALVPVGATFGYVAYQALFALSFTAKTGKQSVALAATVFLAILGLLVVMWLGGKRKVLGYDSPNTKRDIAMATVVFGTAAVALIAVIRNTLAFYVR